MIYLGNMEQISVKKSGDWKFVVGVGGGSNKTEHSVIVDEEYYKRLTNGSIEPSELVTKSFEFLLKREPKESILAEFNLKVISRYFPEYEEEISR